MSAIEEQTTTQSDNIAPAVLIDPKTGIIAVEVFVSQPQGAGIPTISVPLVTIPFLGTWTLLWELRVLTAGLKAHFADPGIVLPKTLPPMTTILSGAAGTETKWSVQLKSEVQKGTFFKYEIILKSAAFTQKVQAQVDLRDDRSRHDPIPPHDPLDPPKPHAHQ